MGMLRGLVHPLRRVAKRTVLHGYVGAVRPIGRAWDAWRGQQRIVVLVYHRVNNQLQDAVTVGVEQFDEQMRYLKNEYPVVRIEDIVHGRVPKDSARPSIAVTFDDGYLDNYENAVPILERYGVPAAFFVSTAMIGSRRGFAHDLRRLGFTLPNMTWDQLRYMRNAGFTIGSHTVTHVNCARTEPAVLRQELQDALETIRRELCTQEVFFAYPYGDRDDITPEAMQLVRDVGYAGCLSAYGGYNRGTVDPFDVLRVGVDNKFDRLAFQARVEGYQLQWWQLS